MDTARKPRAYKYERYLGMNILIACSKLGTLAPSEGCGTGSMVQGTIIAFPKGRRKVFHVQFDHCIWKNGSVEDIETGVLLYTSAVGGGNAPTTAPDGHEVDESRNDSCSIPATGQQEGPSEPTAEPCPAVDDEVSPEVERYGYRVCIC